MGKELITLELEASVRTAVRPSRRVCEVASMFGLGVDEERVVRVVPPMTLRVGRGRVVFVTGASGGGKSTLLRLVREKLGAEHRGVDPGVDPGVRVIDFDGLGEMGDEPLVEGFGEGLGACGLGLGGGEGGEGLGACGLGLGGSVPDISLSDLKPQAPSHKPSLHDVVRWLSLAGLGDAFVMLRRPGELSDGQRYRLRLARAIGEAEGGEKMTNDEIRMTKGEGGLTVVLADEFGATLDRRTAKGIARSVRKWTRRSGVCFIAATTHDDLLESLEPDTLIVQHPGERVEVLERGGAVEPQRHRGTEVRRREGSE